LDFAAHALRDLRLMNISPRTLYPDLHGAAMEANIDPAKIAFISLMFDQKIR
jgi:hypothetical protein